MSETSEIERTLFDIPTMPVVDRGQGFSYVGPDGRVIRDPAERQRIEALAIPPAWTEVWICPLANGHLQAIGRDAKGRKHTRRKTLIPPRNSPP